MINLTDFFNTDFVDYASYDNLRKIASCIDGQKNASRKVLYTVLEKLIKDKIKVSQLGSKVAEFAEYLHGNLDGVIVNLAQDFAGTNNLPLLQKKGNFGTRFAQDASASRYIFTYGSDVFFKLFKKEDCNILKNQTFEGEKIEPLFYVPTLPLILINGSEGVSSGFAQKILPRSYKNILKCLKAKLENKSIRQEWLNPSFNGFNGLIEKGETDSQWKIKGTIKRINQTTLIIDEIPIGYDLKSYIKILDSLEDSKVINSYRDLSDNDCFKFEVKMPSKDLKELSDDDELLQKLKLIKTITENYTCLDENNKIKEFKNANEILDYYINIKLKFLNLRKNFLVKTFQNDLNILQSKIIFIKHVIDGTLIIQKRSKCAIENDLKKIDEIINLNGYDYLLNMPLYSLTKERLEKLSDDYKKTKNKLNETLKLDETKMWILDIDNI